MRRRGTEGRRDRTQKRRSREGEGGKGNCEEEGRKLTHDDDDDDHHDEDDDDDGNDRRYHRSW